MSWLQEILGKNKRTALIRKNILASFLIKGWSVIVQLTLVPLTLYCLGSYENGIWLTISSMLLWIDNLDIGLGNGLRNKLAEHLAHEERDKAQNTISSTIFMLFLVIVPIIIIANLLIWFTDTYSFFNIESGIVSNLDVILCVATIFVCSTFIFKSIGNFYMGLQLPAINNLMLAVGQTLVLIGTAIIYFIGSHSLLLICIVNTISPLIVYIISFPITFLGKYKELRPTLSGIKKYAMKELFSTGMKFFILQIAGVLLFLTSNIIISRVFTPEMVTPYQIAYRYLSQVYFIFTIICAPYWSATTDAFQRGDYAWIKEANITLNKVLLLMTMLLIIMVIISAPVYKLWIGSIVRIPIEMSIIVALYILIITISTRYSFVLNGIGALRLQLIMTVSAAIVYVPLAIIVGQLTHNIYMLLLVMCLVNMPGLVVNIIQYNKIINLKASGIWRI